MINDELLAKFDRIQDLPVSEEMLGAYLEGNISDSELNVVQTAISSDADFESFVSGFPAFPLVYDEKDYDESIDFADDSIFISEIENIERMKDLTRAYNTFGERGENISDPVYIQQPDDHSCALRSQQIVLRDFGIDIPFEQLERLALDYGVYTNQGTYTYDIGRVLQIAGVDMHQVQGSSLMDLTNELAQGHRVIVSVDADELWYNDPMSKLKNWFNDVVGTQGGNHALIVAGVEVNPNNPDDVKVVLTDPGAGHLRIEYPLDQFMDAWKDSTCFMAATNEPAPYQYDAETGMEVPSNFMVQQFVNDFVASNGYQLSPDLINIPEGYQPTFEGHIDTVGDMNFDEFESKYSDIVASRFPSELTVKEQIEEYAKEHSEYTKELVDSVTASWQDSQPSESTQECGVNDSGRASYEFEDESPKEDDTYNDEGDKDDGSHYSSYDKEPEDDDDDEDDD